MRTLMSMMRREKQLRLLFWGILSIMFFLIVIAVGYQTYLTFAPMHGVGRIETNQDAAAVEEAMMNGAIMTVPERCELLGEYTVTTSGQVSSSGLFAALAWEPEENRYYALLLTYPDYSILLMSKGTIAPGDELTVGVRYPEFKDTILAEFPAMTDENAPYLFFDDVPNQWVLTGILAGFFALNGLIYLHVHGKRYLLRHTRLGKEILALSDPKHAFREIKREMRRPILRTSAFVLLEHWVLYLKYEEKRGWHYRPVEKNRVVSSTLNYLEDAPDADDDEETAYQWTLNEITRQHRIMIYDPEHARTAEAYFSNDTGEAL